MIQGDDDRPKPFSFSELSALIRPLLRRTYLPSEAVLVVEDRKLDHVERRAETGGAADRAYFQGVCAAGIPNTERLILIARCGTHTERRLLLAKSCPRFPYFKPVRMVSFGSSKSLWVPTGADK